MGTRRPREGEAAVPGFPAGWWPGLHRSRGLSLPDPGAANIYSDFFPVPGFRSAPRGMDSWGTHSWPELPSLATPSAQSCLCQVARKPLPGRGENRRSWRELLGVLRHRKRSGLGGHRRLALVLWWWECRPVPHSAVVSASPVLPWATLFLTPLLPFQDHPCLHPTPLPAPSYMSLRNKPSIRFQSETYLNSCDLVHYNSGTAARTL